MSETEKKSRTLIDWTNPPKPSMFMQVTLTPKHAVNAGPGIVTSGVLAVRSSAGSKKCPALGLETVLYYVREAAMKDADYRASLERMVASLPSRT